MTYGTFTKNFLFAGTINLLRNVLVYANNVKQTGMDIASRYRVDFGTDPKQIIRYSTDALQTNPFAGGDSILALNDYSGQDLLQNESNMLLKNYFPVDPDNQAIEGGVKRIIVLSVERFISGRAFETPYVQNDFWSIMLGWTQGTKQVADETNFRAWLFTKEADVTYEVDLYDASSATSIADVEKANRLNAQKLSAFMTSLATNIRDYTRALNGFGNLRNYEMGEFDVYGKPETMNKILGIDLPSLFHIDRVKNPFVFEEQHARFFGSPNAAATTGDSTVTFDAVRGKPTVTAVGTVRSFIDQWLPSDETVVSGQRYRGNTRLNTSVTPNVVEHFYFAGDPIADTDTAPAASTNPQTGVVQYYSYTTEDNFDVNGNPSGGAVVDRIRFVHKEAPVLISGWQRADAFYNNRSGVTNNYTVYEFYFDKFLEYPIFDIKANYTLALPN